jgi:hypothetical protein
MTFGPWPTQVALPLEAPARSPRGMIVQEAVTPAGRRVANKLHDQRGLVRGLLGSAE